MKKLTLFLFGLILVVISSSCSKEDKSLNSEDIYFKAANGGNISCANFACSFIYSSGNIDYINGVNSGKFEDINWSYDPLTGTVTWWSDISVNVLFIVKGGTASNYYYLGCGQCSKGGMVSVPINPSNGKPYGLSHIAICYNPCEQPEPVGIVLKGSYWLSYSSYENSIWGDLRYTCSTGSAIYPPSETECNVVGINYYPSVTSIPLFDNVGTIEVAESWPGGVHSFTITADLNEGYVWNQTSLYVGTLAGLGDLSVCPAYMSWPYQDDTKQNTHVFTVPY